MEVLKQSFRREAGEWERKNGEKKVKVFFYKNWFASPIVYIYVLICNWDPCWQLNKCHIRSVKILDGKDGVTKFG